MRRRGWAGNPPGDDGEARARIIEVAIACADRYGPAKVSLSDVASELGVTRQTVYRHFDSTEQLFEAVAEAGVAAYVEELATHLAGLDEPAEVVVEAIVHSVERLPKERYIGLLLVSGRTESFWRGVTSDIAMRFGRAMLTETDVDWAARGFDDAQLDGLVEFALRLLASLVTDPNPSHPSGDELRRFLRRWLAPAIQLEVFPRKAMR